MSTKQDHRGQRPRLQSFSGGLDVRRVVMHRGIAREAASALRTNSSVRWCRERGEWCFGGQRSRTLRSGSRHFRWRTVRHTGRAFLERSNSRHDRDQAGNIAGRGGLRLLEPSYSSTNSPSTSGASGPRRNRRSKGSRGTGATSSNSSDSHADPPVGAPRTALRERVHSKRFPSTSRKHGETSRRGQDDAPRRRNESIPNLGRAHKGGISQR
jgi:hypothetical protein